MKRMIGSMALATLLALPNSSWSQSILICTATGEGFGAGGLPYTSTIELRIPNPSISPWGNRIGAFQGSGDDLQFERFLQVRGAPITAAVRVEVDYGDASYSESFDLDGILTRTGDVEGGFSLAASFWIGGGTPVSVYSDIWADPPAAFVFDPSSALHAMSQSRLYVGTCR